MGKNGQFTLGRRFLRQQCDTLPNYFDLLFFVTICTTNPLTFVLPGILPM